MQSGYEMYRAPIPPTTVTSPSLLRSSTQQLLHVPYMSTDFGRRAFNYSSPATWNSIPTSIKNWFLPIQFQAPLKVSPYSPAPVWPPDEYPRLRFMLNA